MTTQMPPPHTHFWVDLVDPVTSGGGAVSSVNGKTGVVVLNNTDVGADAAGAAAAAQAASQPLDSDLTSIAALATTAFGRSLLTLANAAGLTAAAGLDPDLATFSVPANTTISALLSGALDETTLANFLTALGLDPDLATLSLPASTTISAVGASIVAAATANAALNLLLPAQASNATKVLQTDGTNTSWQAMAAGGATTLDGLTDVTTPTPVDLDGISYDGATTQWKNYPPATQRARLGLAIGTDVQAYNAEMEISGWIMASYSWMVARNNEIMVNDFGAGWGGFPTGTRLNATHNSNPFYGTVINSVHGGPGILANPLTPVSFSSVSNQFARNSHGLVNNDVIWISGGTQPGGLQMFLPYYVVNASTNGFQVSATPGGTFIVLTTSGTCEVRTGTHLTLAPNADYPLTRAVVIVNPRYSYALCPPGWPGWFNYTTAQPINPLTFTLGYSVIPTSLAYNFRVDGNMCTYNLRDGGNGTSNATTLSISLPVQAAAAPAGILWNGSSAIVDNGATVSTAAGLQIAPGATVVQAWRDYGNVGAWTATLGKRIVRGQIIYGV